MKPDTYIPIRILDVQPHAPGAVVFFSTFAKDKVTKLQIDGSVGYSVSLALHGEQSMRPVTHDLFMNLLLAFNAKLEKACITDYKNGIFYTLLTITTEESGKRKIIEIDSRPGDAFALALRFKANIYMKKGIWEQLNDDTAYYELVKDSSTDHLLS